MAILNFIVSYSNDWALDGAAELPCVCVMM